MMIGADSQASLEIHHSYFVNLQFDYVAWRNQRFHYRMENLFSAHLYQRLIHQLATGRGKCACLPKQARQGQGSALIC